MKYFTLLLISLLAAGNVKAGLLPGPEDDNPKLLPGSGGSSSVKVLPSAGSSSNQVLPSGGSSGGKVLPVPAKSTGGGDFFAAPTHLRLLKGKIADEGDNSRATREVGEPLHGNYGGNPGGKSLWWRYESHTNGTMVISTEGSNFDTVLGVYIGDSVGSLTALASDNNGGPNETSLVTVRVFENSIYYIAVDGYNGASGKVKLNMVVVPNVETTDGRPVNDDYADRVQLAGNYVVDYGTNFNATAEPDDLGIIDFLDATSTIQNVWWTWTAPVSGAVTIATAGSDFDTLLYVYRRDSLGNLISVRVHDDVSRTDRSSRIVTSYVTAGEIFDIAVDGWSEGAGFVSLSITQQPSLASVPGDVFDFRIGAKGNSYSFDATTASASVFEDGEPLHAGVTSSGSVWWTWTAPGSGTLAVSATAKPATATTTTASKIKPVIAVYTGPRVSALNEVASATDVDLDGRASLNVRVVKDRIYQIAVANGSFDSGAFTFALTYDSGAPVITSQPVAKSVSAGADTAFTVGVSANTLKPITYSWEKLSGKTWSKVANGTNYSGATTSTLKILKATSAMNGTQYRCIVTNSAGKATSTTVKLTVITAKKTKAKLVGR